MKNIILLLALFPLFLSCTDDDKEEVKHDYFTDFVTGVTVGGDLRPTSIRIDNEMNKISIDFPIGSTPTAIPVELELASGVTMKSPSSTSNTFDLTEIIPIYLEYKGEDYRYLIVGNYLPESIGGGVMQNGPVHDISLLYYGGSHRATRWTEEELQANVTYTDPAGKENWLFDSFLFLETHTGEGRNFENGLGGLGARKTEWQGLVDKYFAADGPIARLNSILSKSATRLGAPKYKRRLIISMPAAYKDQKDWGEISGRAMDFSLTLDCVSACSWYVDYIIRKFNEANLNYLSLDGIYFVAEQLTDNRHYLPQVADYIKSKNLKFYWIPYWGTDGMGEWESMKFDAAFLQPNYFFPAQKPDYTSYFDRVISYAKSKNMALEMEFDERALKKNSQDYRADRLRDYLRAFDSYGIIKSFPIAYYQSDCMVYSLKSSIYEEDRALYNELCTMISKRQKARGEK